MRLAGRIEIADVGIDPDHDPDLIGGQHRTPQSKAGTVAAAAVPNKN